MRAFELVAGDGPVVVDSPHSGTDYPADFGFACQLAALRQAEDTHVEKLWSFVPALGQTLLHARFPRTYLDVNRAADEVDPALLADPADDASATTTKLRLGMGLLWSRTLAGASVYDRRLTRAEVAGRVARCWVPYHEALAAAIDGAVLRHGWCLHLDVHAMPSDPALYARECPGWQPPDFVLGDLDGSSAEPALATLMADWLRAQGFRVDVNYPFRGAELLRRHGAPARRRHSVQVEVSKALYMDERTLAPHAGLVAVRETLSRLLRFLLVAAPRVIPAG